MDARAVYPLTLFRCFSGCRCYLTLTQALHLRMGGNPFGPAGTGKTESVKALGAQLGRFVLVFNCDESFDYSAMGRLFAGLCQVGGWAVCQPLAAFFISWGNAAVFVFCQVVRGTLSGGRLDRVSSLYRVLLRRGKPLLRYS